MLLFGAIALVVIGPKDLPKALRTAGIMVRRARGLAREFHNSIDDMIREAELDEVRKKIAETTRLDADPPAPRIAQKPAIVAPPPETFAEPPEPPAETPPAVTPPEP
jgi:sec-independent protein translocase protein TatB